MICKKCGTVLKEDDVFCINCGEKISADVENEQTASEVSAKGKIHRKSGKKPFVVIGIIAVLLLISASAFFIFKDLLTDIFMKAEPDEKQLQYAYSKLADDLSEKLSSTYSNLTGDFGTDIGMEGTLNIELSDEFSALTGALSGLGEEGDIILSQLKATDSLTVDYRIDNSYSSGLVSIALSLKLADKDLTDASILLNSAEETLILSIPDFFDGALELDISNQEYSPSGNIGIIGGADTPTASLILGKILSDPVLIKNILPEADVLENVLPAIINAAVAEIVNAESNTEVLTVSEVEQKLTCIKAYVSEDTDAKIKIAILKELQSNPGVQAYINKLANAIQNETLLENFEESLKNAVVELESREYSSDDIAVLNTYVDSQYNIHAIELTVFQEEGDIKVFAGKASEGDDVACEVSVYSGETQLFIISGVGKEKSGKASIDYTISAEGEEYFRINCTDIDIKMLEKGHFSGEVEILPGEAFAPMEEMLKAELKENFGITVPKLNFSMYIKGNADPESADLKAELRVFGGSLLDITLENKKTGFEEIELPKNVTDNVVKWAGSVNIFTLIKRLSDCGISEDLIMLLIGSVIG